MKDTEAIAALKRVRRWLHEDKRRLWKTKPLGWKDRCLAHMEAVTTVNAEIRRLRQEQEKGDA